jgi:hypothetical protein
VKIEPTLGISRAPTNGKARQQKTETLTGYTKKQAQAKMAQREAQVVSGNYMQGHATVSMLYKMFIESKRGGKRAPTTRARYGTLYKTYIEPAFCNMTLNDLKPQHLTDAYARWSLKGKSGRPLVTNTCALNRHDHR